MYVCVCNGLTEEEIQVSIKDGAISPGEVMRHYDSYQRCGKCSKEIKDAIEKSQESK